ncbi:hypothetical protein Ae201684P_020081 [Aphanomyces euteiches]|uniref:Reverse transcriptase Ty1/copia-type domain-containing protein n=1 Tax=Aphanomyces euteiches TaxID=100861 RepID=A0A6G0W5T1_9STRA|nr:hypothetical protein Ae201684_018663 [Aphanomyces euteiches]KAH9071822.1 hypothetical protein Ae201684P_020081 [Aphanomyces euteiches]KAH9136605.1 hypothetical protein AeRB84_018338 [Aphanomyces euteiches]
MFANDEFSHGRLSIPNYVKFKDISSHEELTLRRFAEPTSELTNAIIASSAKVETGGQEAKLRPTRAIKRPKRFEVNLVTTHAMDSRPRISEPLTMQDMRSSVEVEQWKQAMDEEYQALVDNGVWRLMALPKGRKALKSKWIWKVKYQPNGDVERFKARLCIKGFLQIAGVDFTGTFAPVLRLESLRVLCALIAKLDLATKQLDIKTAFLKCDLEEEIYMEQPEGYVIRGSELLVCRLQKSLYGLKQAPRQWHKKLHAVLAGSIVYLAVYVDDITLAGKSEIELDSVSNAIKAKFQVTDKGELGFILGIHVVRNRSTKTLKLSQTKFVEELLTRFNMADCHPVATPQAQGTATDDIHAEDTRNVPYQSLVGALQYLVSATRPDIANSVRYLSSHNHDHNQTHWRMAKRVLKYLKGTSDKALTFQGTLTGQPVAFCDADFANDLNDSKSVTGFVVMLAGAAVVYASKKQSLVGQSTTEVEFIAAAEAAKSIIWLAELLTELRCTSNGPITLFVDNQSAIQVAQRTSAHGRTKHIRLRYHFLKDLVSEGMIHLEYINTTEQIADTLTKSLVPARFVKLRAMLGLV